MPSHAPPALRSVLLATLLAAPLASPGAPAAAQEPPLTVAIGNFTFDPPVLTVPVGAAVTWVNRDDIPHTATSATGLFGSPALDTDEHFAFRFDQPGSYRYFCKLHPHMSGTIEVTRRAG